MGLTRQQKIMVTVLLSGTLLAVLNQTLLSPALPVIMADLQVNATTIQWLTSAYSLVEAIIIPLSAWLVGRFRTRQLFAGSMALFAVGSFLAVIAPTFPILLLGRIFQAMATGVMMPMVFTLILLIFPREQRGAGMGLVTLIISFAPAIGPSLSGVMVDSVGWRALFIIVTALAIVVMLFSLKALKDWEGFERSRFDVPSVIMSSIGMVAFLYGLSTFTAATNLTLTAVLVVAGLAFIALFVRRQLTIDQPLLRVDILKSRKYRTVVIVMFLLQASMIGLSVILPLYVQNVLGQSATVTGFIMLPGAILGAIAGLIAGRMFDRHGVRGLALTGSCLMLVGGIGLFALQIDSSVLFVAAVYTILIFAIQLSMTPLNTWGVNSLDNGVIQHANALSNTLNQVGGSFGTALIVSLTALAPGIAPAASPVEQSYLGIHIALGASLALVVVVFLTILLFVRDRPQDRVEKKERARAVTGRRVYRVADVMNPNSATIPEGVTVAQAIELFSEVQTSGAPIVNDKHEVVGFLSNGDIMKYLGNVDVSFTNSSYSIFGMFGDESIQRRVGSLLDMGVDTISTKRVLSVEPDDTIEEACTILSDRRIKKLPVIDDGKLVGVISRRNVIDAIAEVVPRFAQPEEVAQVITEGDEA